MYLTAIFGLRPTRRKAAVLERIRAEYEALFWQIIGEWQPQADVVAAETEPAMRRQEWLAARKRLGSAVIAAATKAGLAEPVAMGLLRDLTMAISSYVEKRVGGQGAEWPKQEQVADYADRLDRYANAIDRRTEKTARDDLLRGRLTLPVRPLTLARSRDAMLVRKGPHGAIAAVLNILRSDSPDAQAASIHEGIEAASRTPIKRGRSTVKLVVPVECSKWHEYSFLDGKCVLRSSLVFRRDNRWFLAAQFEQPEAEKVRQTGARIGIDRAITAPIIAAAVRADGGVAAVAEPHGTEVGPQIERAEAKRRWQQRRGRVGTAQYRNRVDMAMQLLANAVVAEAKSRGAKVVMENRKSDKQLIVKKRPAWAKGQGRHYLLRRAQLGKLEELIEYKLQKAGLPPIQYVVGGGLRKACMACGGGPVDQGACAACGAVFPLHVERAVKLARRGVIMTQIKRGDKLAPREQDMAVRLSARSDGGLGPLAGIPANGLVAGRASAPQADPALAGVTSGAGQNERLSDAKPERVIAERRPLFSSRGKSR